jgi:hypothetical protein
MNSINQDEINLQEKCQQLVAREVFYCVSMLISHLAEKEPDNEELLNLMTNYDYEAAAFEEGWRVVEVGDRYVIANPDGESVYNAEAENTESFDEDDFEEDDEITFDKWLSSLDEDYFFDDKTDIDFDTWQKLCQSESIDPQENEVLEHWIVSDWLADKLEEKGETVVDDLYGLTVWGRTTSGQSISMDHVIRQITQELHSDT